MASNYLVNQVIAIKGKRIILLFDSYGVRNKSKLKVLDASAGFNFYIEQGEIQSIRKSYKDVKVFGFWSLLYANGLLDLTQDSNSFVVYQDDGKTEGFYLTYDRSATQFSTGLIIGGKPIGAMGLDIENAHIIEADVTTLKLSDEILLPIERKRIKQQFYQTIAIQNIIATLIIAGAAFAISSLMFNYSDEVKQSKKAINKANKVIRERRSEITKLKINNMPTNLVNVGKLKLFKPLSALALTRTKGVNFETNLSNNELSFVVEVDKENNELPLWIYPLYKTYNFKALDDKNGVVMKWSGDE